MESKENNSKDQSVIPKGVPISRKKGAKVIVSLREESDSALVISSPKPSETNNQLQIITSVSENTRVYLSITLEAIKDFVKDLVYVFGTKNRTSSLDLYHRLLVAIKDTESEEGLKKFIDGFRIFFTNNLEHIENIETVENIPKGTVIRYAESPKIYIDIQSFIYRSKNVMQKETIRQHLATISAALNPNERSISILESPAPLIEKMKLRHGSSEAFFITEILKKVKESLAKEKADVSPVTAIKNLMSSGMIEEIANKMRHSIKDKSIDIPNLVACLQEALSEFVMDFHPEDDDEDGQELHKTLSGFSGLLGALDDNSNYDI